MAPESNRNSISFDSRFATENIHFVESTAVLLPSDCNSISVIVDSSSLATVFAVYRDAVSFPLLFHQQSFFM